MNNSDTSFAIHHSLFAAAPKHNFTPSSAIILNLPKSMQHSPISAARTLLSLALQQSLNASPIVHFGLVLDRDIAQILIHEIKGCDFFNWQASIHTHINNICILDFSCRFELPALAPNITIIIPTFNNSKEELRRAVLSAKTSIEAGGFANKSEIIISDDGSYLSSEWIFNEFESEQSKNIRIVQSKRNRGVVHARNTGLKAAKNRYVLFLDADDELHQYHALALVSQLLMGAEVAACDMKLPIESGLICAKKRHSQEIFYENSFGSGIAIDTMGCQLKKILRHQSLFNPIYFLCYEDWELNCVLHLIGAKIAIVPAPLYLYYRKAGGRDDQPSRLRNIIKRTLPFSARFRIWLTKVLNF